MTPLSLERSWDRHGRVIVADICASLPQPLATHVDHRLKVCNPIRRNLVEPHTISVFAKAHQIGAHLIGRGSKICSIYEISRPQVWKRHCVFGSRSSVIEQCQSRANQELALGMAAIVVESYAHESVSVANVRVEGLLNLRSFCDTLSDRYQKRDKYSGKGSGGREPNSRTFMGISHAYEEPGVASFVRGRHYLQRRVNSIHSLSLRGRAA
jgi:hypothetical protein